MAAPNSKRQRLLAPAPNSAAASTSAARGSTNRRGAGAAKSAKSHYKEPGPGSVQLGDGAAVTFSTDLLGSSESVALFDTLRRELPWEQRCVRVMGRAVQQPRLIAYQADGPGLQYTYSGATLRPAAWHPAVHALKGRVEAAVGADVLPPGGFNSCLLNLYRSGADSIAWHSDNEPLFGRWPTIASVSLGTPRDFLLRCNVDPGDKYRFRLGGGAMLVMFGSVQEGWMHSVPKRTTLTGERISLTFRRIVVPEQQR